LLDDTKEEAVSVSVIRQGNLKRKAGFFLYYGCPSFLSSF